jgi:hypothetical protein
VNNNNINEETEQPKEKIDNLNCEETLIKIQGNIKNPLEFKLSDYKEFETIITAQFIGCKDKKNLPEIMLEFPLKQF